jgi:hypothetical protein
VQVDLVAESGDQPRIFVVAHDNVRIVSDFSQANQIVETEALCG